MHSFLPALLLCTLLCAAVDVRLTWADHAYRPHDGSLVWQTLVAWGLLALLVALPVRWASRRWSAPFASALACMAAPIALHQSLRDALRGSSVSWPTTLSVLAGALLVVALCARLERKLLTTTRSRVLCGSLLALVALSAISPGLMALARINSPAATLEQRHDAPPARPNILLLVWDTTRADHTSPYGADASITPHLAQLAEQGLVFDSAWSSSLFTLSSHTSLLTGLPPTMHGTTLRNQTLRTSTVASTLSEMGYRTGAFVGTSVLVGGRGLDGEFDIYDDRVDPAVSDTRIWSLVHDVQATLAALVPALGGNGLPHGFQDFQRPAGDVLDAAQEFILADDAAPWFVMVNLFDVHWPYLPSADAQALHGTDYTGPLTGHVFRANGFPADYQPNNDDKAFVSGLYDAEMWELDQAVDRFLNHIDYDRGDMAVVMTSDHGEGLGENGQWSHEIFVAPQTHVPLIVYAPGRVEAGQRVATHVSGLDVAPTILALANAQQPGQSQLPGSSLLSGTPPSDRMIFVQNHDNVDPSMDSDAVLRGRFKLVCKPGQRTLHDLIDDSLDMVDIGSEHPDVVAELGQALDDLLALQSHQADSLDNLDALRALGYMGN
ncbi:MAG: arylsulfatase A-like enzyme [Pseudohongiellaceae bacterium]|jgi:arylsulfatase A-like enzyme